MLVTEILRGKRNEKVIIIDPSAGVVTAAGLLLRHYVMAQRAKK